MSASMVRIEWPDDSKGNPVRNRFYADSWTDVQNVLDEMSTTDRLSIMSIAWPDREPEDGPTQCECGAIYYRSEVLPACPACAARYGLI